MWLPFRSVIERKLESTGNRTGEVTALKLGLNTDPSPPKELAMRRNTSTGLALALLLSAGAASAEESLLDYVLTSCESDLEAYCRTVTPGEGRLLYCVAAHEDKISGQCSYALYQAATLLEELAVAISYLAKSCGEEIDTLCGSVEMGEGRVLACLESNREALGETCASALGDTTGS
jgi:hypothetical protein